MRTRPRGVVGSVSEGSGKRRAGRDVGRCVWILGNCGYSVTPARGLELSMQASLHGIQPLSSVARRGGPPLAGPAGSEMLLATAWLSTALVGSRRWLSTNTDANIGRARHGIECFGCGMAECSVPLGAYERAHEQQCPFLPVMAANRRPIAGTTLRHSRPTTGP